jgi:TolB-like protein/DNA-binding winged helix-turn-helix (wHTH) protein/Tfp pilus assembly protein PilF
VFRIGDWRVEPALDEISKDGKTIKLEPRAMQVLLCLAQRANEVVGVDDLLNAVWKDVVVTQDSVYQAVAALRRALGDDPKNPTYIANVLRRGYRLVAPVTADAEPSAPVNTGTTADPGAGAPARGSAPAAATSARSRWVVSGLAVMLALAAGLIARFTHLDAPPPQKSMLVVLPFENLTGDPRQDYFADGMSEELITQLGALDPNHLGVIARTSSMQYKGAHKDVGQIARELGVAYVLEGSVRSAHERMRVTAQLIAARDQTHLWAESFDRDSSDILRVQAGVARAVADQIKLTLSQQASARLTGAPSASPEAHDAYLQGLQWVNLRTREGFEQAIAAFHRAIALEPNYAPAYAGLARTYSLGTVVGLGSPPEMMREARDAALKALQIDDTIASAHTTLAFIHAHFEFDWAAAEREYQRGIALNPSDANGHFFYSNSLLSPHARHEEAIAEMKTAIELDPLSAPIDSFLGLTYLWARRYQEALTHLQQSTQRYPNFVLNHVRLARLYTYVNRFADAIAEDTKARVLSGQDPREAVRQEDALRAALAQGGTRGYWEQVRILSQSGFNAPEGYDNSYGMAKLSARLEENDKAVALLERAYTERQLSLTEVAVEPAFDSLRSNERFQALLRRMGVGQ